MAFSIGDFVTEIDGFISVSLLGERLEKTPLFTFFFDLQRNKKTKLDWEISTSSVRALEEEYNVNKKQLLTMDILAPVTMKNAAKCDT